jgi:hypothetical protein
MEELLEMGFGGALFESRLQNSQACGRLMTSTAVPIGYCLIRPTAWLISSTNSLTRLQGNEGWQRYARNSEADASKSKS